MFIYYLAVAVAGGVGTLARFSIQELAVRFLPTHLPLATFAVNMVGCLGFGIAVAVLNRHPIDTGGTWMSLTPQQIQTVVLTGFLGGFTTFSAFAFHNQQFLIRSEYGCLCLNMIGQNVLGVFFIAAGWYVVNLFGVD